jgi:hypothetical protein
VPDSFGTVRTMCGDFPQIADNTETSSLVYDNRSVSR